MNIKNFLEQHKEEYKHWLEDKLYEGQHIKILPYLQDIEKGTFIEAGACDGIFQSNTKILEELGWSGILIEPSTVFCEQCKNNRKSIVENYALVSFDYNEEFIKGFNSHELINNGTGLHIMANDPSFLFPVKTLTDICKQHNFFNVDFFSLDVEGYEMEVLKGIDFDLIKINYCLIEWNSNYSFDDLTSFMNNKNYELIADISNFTKENCPTWPGTHQDYLFKSKNL